MNQCIVIARIVADNPALAGDTRSEHLLDLVVRVGAVRSCRDEYGHIF